jgi:hypothetical protein
MVGAGTVLAARAGLPRYGGGGYALLRADASYPDRALGDLLQRGAVTYISESTQRVFLDTFGALEQIPLDEYRDRVEAFDPRNDGYADKLSSFFVNRGKRSFYIPLAGQGFKTPRGLEKRVAAALGDIPYSLDFLNPPRSPFREWIRNAPLGFALSAVLAGLFRVLRDPLGECAARRRYGRKPGGADLFRLFRPQWLLGAVLLAVYGIICVSGGIALPGLGGLAVFAGILRFALAAESGRREGHIRFLPAPIRGFSLKRAPFPGVMIPFALASLAFLLVPPLFSGPAAVAGAVETASTAAAVPETAVSETGGGAGGGVNRMSVLRADYEAHLAFQASFSITPLGREGAYPEYTLGEDGLLTGVPDTGPGPGIPDQPFPLADLAGFLEYGEPPQGGRWIPVCLVWGLCVPPLFQAGQRYRRKKKILIYNDKRIAA